MTKLPTERKNSRRPSAKAAPAPDKPDTKENAPTNTDTAEPVQVPGGFINENGDHVCS